MDREDRDQAVGHAPILRRGRPTDVREQRWGRMVNILSIAAFIRTPKLLVSHALSATMTI